MDTTQTKTAKAGLAVILAASIGSGVAHLGTSTMPFLIGALMDGAHYSASQAGLYGFFLVGALALAMILVAPVMHRVRPRIIIAIGVLLAALAHAVMYWLVPGLLAMCVLATIGGTGFGLIFAGVVVASAAYANADRLYAFSNAGAVVYIVAVMAAFPLASIYFGVFGPFLFVAALVAIALPMAIPLAVPASAITAQDQPGNGQLRKPEVWALLLSWAVFSLGTGASWSFAERVGHNLAIPATTIGVILSASTAFGVAGSSLAAALAGRIPRVTALAVSLTLAGISCALLGNATGTSSYAFGVASYWLSYMFVYPTMLGTAAAMDPSGKVGTMGGGCERMGYALGAWLGGVMVDHTSLGTMGFASAAACVVTLPFALPIVARALHQRGL